MNVIQGVTLSNCTLADRGTLIIGNLTVKNDPCSANLADLLADL
jgi:hypothetical protein